MAYSETTEHRLHIEMDEDEDGYYWECSCGKAGSGSGGFLRADVKSDEHIPTGESRIDTNKPY